MLRLSTARATNPGNDDVDILALDSFSNVIRSDEAAFAQPATKLLVQKIHSNNTKEALLALEFLEGCMDCCGHRFVEEVGKFKFLNELIKLVSKKHLGDKTPREIQSKILDILFSWTTEYPDVPKIRDAYDMLKQQGIVHEPTKNVMVSSVARNFHQPLDARQTMLKKLINSKNKDDIAKANLLIQNMCREDERRQQIRDRRITEYKKACESVSLLNEMLDSYEPATASSEELAIINEIHDTCDLFQPTLLKLVHEMDQKDELVVKILAANDTLVAVLDKYRRKVVLGEEQGACGGLLDDILSLNAPQPPKTTADKVNVLDELGDIFTSNATDVILPTLVTKQEAPPKYEALRTIEKEKEREKEKPPPPPPLPMPKRDPRSLDSLDALILDVKSKLMPQNGKEEQVVEEVEKIDDDQLLGVEEVKSEEIEIVSQPEPVKPLAEIDLKLDEIQPSSLPPRVVLDEPQGLKISLNFVRDRPRDDCLVVVISTINQGPTPIKNFQFDASVPKPCKLRLLAPSGSDIPGVKLFQPPSGAFQILLVANPTGQPVKLTCILSYGLDNDPDPVKESIEVNDLPYKCE